MAPPIARGVSASILFLLWEQVSPLKVVSNRLAVRMVTPSPAEAEVPADSRRRKGRTHGRHAEKLHVHCARRSGRALRPWAPHRRVRRKRFLEVRAWRSFSYLC
eukprot:scaffold63_cov306-Pinguiococcus_pyrenoidosus.AAC.75